MGGALAERFPAIDLGPILKLVSLTADMVTATDSAKPICDDPDDDKFFLCAFSARCEIIVSGDKHLLKKSGFGGVKVLKPRDFLEKILI